MRGVGGQVLKVFSFVIVLVVNVMSKYTKKEKEESVVIDWTLPPSLLDDGLQLGLRFLCGVDVEEYSFLYFLLSTQNNLRILYHSHLQFLSLVKPLL